MKVGILTFHRCINYGSYWQARCLVEGVRASGHDAELLDHDCIDVRRAEWRCAFQPQLPTRTPRALYRQHAAKARHFLAAFDRLPQTPRFALDAPESHGHDVVLVGSDEVWNFRHPWYGSKAIFFGEGLDAGRIASYAASFGNHDAAEGIDPWWAEKLRRFSALSVRDENSRELVRQALGAEPDLVLDPCLQFPPAKPAPVDQPPYLALYGHGFPDWFREAVRQAAMANGWEIRSIGYHNDWADVQAIDTAPEDFPGLIAGAAAVATNFFHGCVFALAMERPFVCAATPYRRNKVRDLTQLLGAERHLVDSENADRIPELLAAPLDPAIGMRIEAQRAESAHYLERVLG